MGKRQPNNNNNNKAIPSQQTNNLPIFFKNNWICDPQSAPLWTPQSLWTCPCRQAAAVPLNHNQRILRRYSILVTSLFKEKWIPGKREGHDSLFCISLIPLSPLGQGENKAWAGPVAAKAPSGVLSRSAFPKPQHCREETQLADANVPKSRQTADFSSPGSLLISYPRATLCHASPGRPRAAQGSHVGCPPATAWRSTSYFRHYILTGYSTAKLHPILYINVGI